VDEISYPRAVGDAFCVRLVTRLGVSLRAVGDATLLGNYLLGNW
jgi:hypothetical protein